MRSGHQYYLTYYVCSSLHACACVFGKRAMDSAQEHITNRHTEREREDGEEEIGERKRRGGRERCISNNNKVGLEKTINQLYWCCTVPVFAVLFLCLFWSIQWPRPQMRCPQRPGRGAHPPALRLRKWRRQLGFVSTSRCDVDARGLGLGGVVALRCVPIPGPDM